MRQTARIPIAILIIALVLSSLIIFHPSSAVTSNGFTITLGNVNASYGGPVYIPVYITGGQNFANLNQTFSFDPTLLAFNSVLNDVSSQNVTFSTQTLADGIIQIIGIGKFGLIFSNTTLYYLVFNPVSQVQAVTTVLLDQSIIGQVTSNLTAQSTVTLAQGWTNLGPRNITGQTDIGQTAAGNIVAVGYSQDLKVIYAGSGNGGPFGATTFGAQASGGVYGHGGVFRSTDSGSTWMPVDMGLNYTAITCIAVDPSNLNIVVVATAGTPDTVGGAIYKTINGGDSWQQTYNMGGNALVYEGNILYAATYNAILESQDFGSTWQVINSFDKVVTTLAVGNNGATIYLGLAPQDANLSPSIQVLRSTNYGKTYTTIFDGNQTSVSQIIINPSNQQNIWALIWNGQGHYDYPPLFESFDGGDSWITVNETSIGLSGAVSQGYDIDFSPQYITYDPINGSVMYIAFPSGLYKSTDSGQDFTLQPIGYDERMLSVDPFNDSVIFMGSDQGLFISKDSAKTWNSINNISSSLLYDVATNGQQIFTVVQDFAPIISNDSGKTWFVNQTIGGETGSVYVDPYNNSIVIYFTYAHIPQPPFYVSNNGGLTFYMPRINLTELSSMYASSPDNIAFSSNSNNTIFVTGGAGIFRSDDHGQSWQLTPNTPIFLRAITVDPEHPNILYASRGNDYLVNNQLIGLYKSTDYGYTWTRINQQWFTSIAVDPNNSSIIVASYVPAIVLGQLYVSFDGGNSFAYDNISCEDCFQNSPMVYFISTNQGEAIVYANDQGIQVSYNLGDSWNSRNWNLPAPAVTAFFLSSNGTSYISTYGTGIWSDQDFFNNVFQQNQPLLTAWVSQNSQLYVNNALVTNEEGYIAVTLNAGPNSLKIINNGVEQTSILDAINSGVYYIDFSTNISPESSPSSTPSATPTPTASPTSTATTTPTPTTTPNGGSNLNPTATPKTSNSTAPTQSPTSTPAIPEISMFIFTVVLLAVATIAALAFIRNRKIIQQPISNLV